MSNLIDREAWADMMAGDKVEWAYSDGYVVTVDRGHVMLSQLVAERVGNRPWMHAPLPAAVPVCDVEDAAITLFVRRSEYREDGYSWDDMAEPVKDRIRADARAVLKAGYAGKMVTADDLRRAALYLEAENTPEAREIAKRLQAAVGEK